MPITSAPTASPRSTRILLGGILDEVGISGRIAVPEGVDACWRENDDAKYLFLINFNDTECAVNLPMELSPLIGGVAVNGTVTLSAHSVGIYQCALARVRSDSDGHGGEPAMERHTAAI